MRRLDFQPIWVRTMAWVPPWTSVASQDPSLSVQCQHGTLSRFSISEVGGVTPTVKCSPAEFVVCSVVVVLRRFYINSQGELWKNVNYLRPVLGFFCGLLKTSEWQCWGLSEYPLKPRHMALIYKTPVYGCDPMSLYEHASETRWVQVRPGETEWVQANPSVSKWSQINPSECKWDQVCPNGLKWIHVKLEESKWQEVRPSETKWVQVNPSKTKLDQVSPSETEWEPSLPPTSYPTLVGLVCISLYIYIYCPFGSPWLSFGCLRLPSSQLWTALAPFGLPLSVLRVMCILMEGCGGGVIKFFCLHFVLISPFDSSLHVSKSKERLACRKNACGGKQLISCQKTWGGFLAEKSACGSLTSFKKLITWHCDKKSQETMLYTKGSRLRQMGKPHQAYHMSENPRIACLTKNRSTCDRTPRPHQGEIKTTWRRNLQVKTK